MHVYLSMDWCKIGCIAPVHRHWSNCEVRLFKVGIHIVVVAARAMGIVIVVAAALLLSSRPRASEVLIIATAAGVVIVVAAALLLSPSPRPRECRHSCHHRVGIGMACVRGEAPLQFEMKRKKKIRKARNTYLSVEVAPSK
jgi:hypothetical protein